MAKPKRSTKRSTPVDTLGEIMGATPSGNHREAKPKASPAVPPSAPVPAAAPVAAPVGRPRKETESHTVRFYGEEWDAIREAAFRQKRTHSDIIRRAICRELGLEFREED